MPSVAERQAAIDLLVEEGVIEKAEDGELLTEAQVDKAMAVDNWINDLGGFDDAAIVVYQVDPKTNKMEYIESTGVQEMTGPMLFERLKNEYGGGKFRIQMRADGAIRKTQTVLIKKVPIKEGEAGGLGIDLPSLVRELKAGQNNGGGMEAILTMMQAQNAQFQQMFTTLVTGMNNAPAQPVVDPMAMQTSMLAGIAEMQKLAGLNKAEKSPTDLILEGVKLVGAIKGEGEGGEANIYSVLTKAIGGFGETLGNAMNMAPPAGMLAPGAPGIPNQPPLAPGGQLTDATKPAEESANKDTPLGQPTLPPDHPFAPFEPFVDWMLALAHKEANPDLYAEVIIDQIGADMAKQWLASEDGISKLKEILPKVQPYENWLRLVGREILVIIEENEKYVLESERGQDAPPIDGDAASVDNPSEVSSMTDDLSNQDVDAPTGSISPGPLTLNPSPLDGHTERPGGDQSNVTVDGEFSESSEDDTANT